MNCVINFFQPIHTNSANAAFMLPESKFPVTGGTMQTEEVVPRAQSTGINSCLTESSAFQHHLHHSVHIKCPLLPPLLHMAVKQEPQEEEEQQPQQRGREVNPLSSQGDAKNKQTSIDGEINLSQQTGHPIQGLDENIGQIIPDLGSRGRPSRGRRKSRWKLKFHHQALPPEYLDHYEASLAQEALNVSPTHLGDRTASSPAPTSSTSTPSPIADVQGWLQRIAAMQQELCPQVISPHQTVNNIGGQVSSSSRRSVITSTSLHNHSNNNNNNNNNNSLQSQNHQTQQPTTRPPMKYSDLPYMGEITLDNSKPRRGRKPKKADICHLIYKNYGTILPGTPGHEEKRLSPRQKVEFTDSTTATVNAQHQQQQQQTVSFQRTDVQNRISSLLEKRLTQESKRNVTTGDNHQAKEQEEPLNLCIKDLNQLKIRLLRKHGNIYESGRVKSEVSSDGEEVECLGTGLNNIDADKHHPVGNLDHHNNINNNNNIVAHNNNNNNNINNNNIIDPVVSPNPGFVYWPSTGIFIHPMSLQSQLLYYQKIAENEKSVKEQKIMPKSFYSMMNAKNDSTTTSPPLPSPVQLPPVSPLPNQTNSVQSVSSPSGSPRSKRNAPIGQPQPTKRKRSAIFIPPMPSENNNNPATEVSICKFKFTGGAKPSLQEKKSLSVDSGGNFRYYSGTGDKSMRGYEFFPREALQQSPGQSGSSTGAFLNATGEKLPSPISSRPPSSSSSSQEDNRRKRKTRKSLQREKLEQTFKEKGFLIQTQQLESAEGATYCKFRQLRKFTRYLFRSWKDYLPGNVRELTGTTADGEIIDPDETDTSVGPTTQIPHANMVDVSSAFVDDSRSLPLT